jgi:EAL domain-containing protein (putative c-di-GMP-specific phosphodiesterase class I)
MPISVNLSPRLLLDEDFATCLATLLTNHPMATRSDLEIELLDSGAIVNQANATAAIHSCRALGVRVAVDDFGSGYATLSYFRHLPVDLLKIDQAFVRDMCDDAESLAIVEGSIQIAKGFNREVVAKGVETVEQGKRLIQIGCHVAQGYAIARPMAADEVPHWIESWSWHPM